MKSPYLFRDQYGDIEFAVSPSELRKRLGGRMSKLYVDSVGGTNTTRHIGYVIGKRWFTQYKLMERAA